MGGFNLQDMLAQARQQAEKLQEKMQQITIEASSGGGSVTVQNDRPEATAERHHRA